MDISEYSYVVVGSGFSGAVLAERIAAEQLDNAGVRARQVMIVLEGAVAQMLIHRDPSYVQAAGQIAANILTKVA